MKVGHSPAYIIYRRLLQNGIVDDPTDSDPEWPGYVGMLPDGENVNDQAVAFIDTTPLRDGRPLNIGANNGEPYFHYGVQVLLRCRDYNAGYQRMGVIAGNLGRVANIILELASGSTVYTYTLYNVSETSGILSLGQEAESTKRRELFSDNFQVTFDTTNIVT